MPHYQYNHAVVGGTFDHLHKGHRQLLDSTFSLAKKITVGITSDNYAAKKSSTVESLEKRLTALKSYAFHKIDKNRLNVIVIDDVFGTTLQDSTMDVIVTTQETRSQATLINKKRRKSGMTVLSIKSQSLIKDENNFIIRSSRIRDGEIDRDGNLFKSLFSKRHTLILPTDMRHTLRAPLGTILPNEKSAIKYMKTKSPFVITVGDIVTRTFREVRIAPKVSIIDFKTKRVEIDHPQYSAKKIKNEPGTLSYKAVNALRCAIKRASDRHINSTIIIRGEEDLLALPAILFAPLSSYVVYGLAEKGVVIIEVTEVIKKKICSFIEKFQKKQSGQNHSVG